MKDFFYAIIIIFIAVFSILVYYLLKDILNKRMLKSMKDRIKHKRYTDQKYYLKSYITHYLSYLERGDLFWIVVFSRQYPDVQIQISYNYVLHNINMIASIENSDKNIENKLSNEGVNQLKKVESSYLLNLKLDPELIVNIIFLIFEFVHKRRYNLNVWIKVS